ncbi:MAG: T9SS type A sorting domain-containing protein [Bacteroidia bacterium]|nr:T9SS type A sorting domain-containing protein [Bacteroidia bacterium]MCF8426964.1 T9SS type A sorting domain-containing protein [Bacteroidia bacterium]MCF8447597.1 T9SS type A sorting domain-containing protein [Bacteroidia bacterium]
MKHIKKLFAILLLINGGNALAQVPQTAVVEHFTNTYCSVCASRNPGFYSNLNQQTNLLHIAFHPSAPYAACTLNQHNKIENDERTKFYGIYGSTPRLVISGTVIPTSANYSSSSIFTPYLGKTSPIEIKVQLTENGSDSLMASIQLITRATHMLGDLNLLVALVEENLPFASPNGEQEHHDVFRKAFASINGIALNAPTQIGDSIWFKTSIAKNSVWVKNQLYAMAMLSDFTSKEIVQAARSSNLGLSNGLSTEIENFVSVFPNPANEFIHFSGLNQGVFLASIYDMQGKLIRFEPIKAGGDLDVSAIPNGFYNLQISNDYQVINKRISIQHP